jgi:hypothetical protein
MSDFEALDTLIGGTSMRIGTSTTAIPWAAVERFVLWEPEYAPSVRAEVDKLLVQCGTDEEVERMMDTFGLGYAATTAGWASYGTWLLAVADRVDELLHTSPAA